MCKNWRIELLETRMLFSGVTYYLSPTGNDSNPGTSLAQPWKTIARADQETYAAADSLLLQGGATFTGNLIFTASDSGSASSPVTVGSFGAGRATISAGTTDGITVTDTSNVSISDLNIIGAGTGTNTGAGINLFDDQVGQPRLSNITIDGVVVSGFGFVGIGIGSATLTTGFNNVRITNSTTFNDDEVGIFSYAGDYTANPAPYGLAHSNIYVGHCIAYDNAGHSGNNDSGNGIQLGDVDGAVIERCIAYGNGADNVATGGGPVGIWAFNANNVTIQYNESYANTALHIDGDGFDLDGGVTNSVVQYNYSHDNAGPGYLAAQFADATTYSGNVFRYNISQNDGRNNSFAAFNLWSASASDPIMNTEIYGNTVYLSKPSGGSPPAIEIEQATTNVSIFNNIFDVASGLKTLVVQYVGTGLHIDGNDYWTGSANAVGITWGSNSYQTLASFQSATKQETVSGSAVGLAVNPQLQDAGGGGAIASPDQLEQLPDYELTSGSSLIGGGINPASLGINPGSTDYYGHALPTGVALNIGACQQGTSAALNLSSTTASVIYLKLSSDETILDIWQNAKTPGVGTPTSTVAVAAMSSLSVGGAAGSALTLDFSNGDPLGALAIKVQDTGTGNSLSVIGTEATDAIQINTGSLTFDATPISFAGVQSIAITAGEGTSQLKQIAQPAATLVFSGNPAGADQLIVNAGTFTFGGDAANLSIDVFSTLVLASGKVGAGITERELSALTIEAGATVLAQSATSSSDRQLIELGALTVAGAAGHWTGKLDLQNNDLIVHSGNLPQLTNMIGQGYDSAGNLWQGEGIDSSAAASDAGHLTSLGVIVNQDSKGNPIFGSGQPLGLFDNISPSASDVLIKYTSVGDINLDGQVDGSDYTRIDNGFNSHLTGWFNGDLNFDGSVDGDDYVLIDNAFNKQSAAAIAEARIAPASAISTPAAAVPNESWDSSALADEDRKRHHLHVCRPTSRG